LHLLAIEILVLAIQSLIFVAGAAHAWDVGALAAVVLGVGIGLVPRIGKALLAGMTFYGAYVAMGWPMWQALIVASPWVVLPLMGLAGSVAVALVMSLALPRS
jgi:hypothetical protein